MSDEACERCAFFEWNQRRKTLREGYEDDARPERPKGIAGAMRYLWDPSKFRRPPPDGEIDAYIDSLIEEGSNSGRCIRWPRSVKVSPRYRCGEFSALPPERTTP